MSKSWNTQGAQIPALRQLWLVALSELCLHGVGFQQALATKLCFSVLYPKPYLDNSQLLTIVFLVRYPHVLVSLSYNPTNVFYVLSPLLDLRKQVNQVGPCPCELLDYFRNGFMNRYSQHGVTKTKKEKCNTWQERWWRRSCLGKHKTGHILKNLQGKHIVKLTRSTSHRCCRFTCYGYLCPLSPS